MKKIKKGVGVNKTSQIIKRSDYMHMQRSARLTRRQIFVEHEKYVPLTAEEMELICSKLAVKDIVDEECKINILYPYCGEGQMLKKISETLGATLDANKINIYGIEKDKDKRRVAQKIAKKVVLGSYGDVRATNGVFSLIILHPPIGGKNPIGLPREAVAFGDLSLPGKYLYPGAVMVTVIHHKILKNIAQLLSIRFTDIEVGRISQDRIVIFGIRSKGRVDNELAKEQREYILALAEDPCLIGQLSNRIYEITPTKENVTTFRSYILDDEELAEDVSKSSLWSKIEDALTPQSRVVKAPKPLLPLNTTHIAVAAAAGVINGRTGDHYRKGVIKEYIETMTLEEDSGYTTIETRRHISRVRIFSRDGVFDLEN